MYIEIRLYDYLYDRYDYGVYAANHRKVLSSENAVSKSACIRAAKKMARRLGIEYREVK